MAWLTDIWPFVPGQQRAIFYITGLAIFGLIAVNVYSAFRQRWPVQKIVAAFFSDAGASSRIERYARIVLIAWLVLGFFVLVLDTQVNGMQLVDPHWAKNK